ncbi:MAG: dynamin family protein [Bacteroidota bacterium]
MPLAPSALPPEAAALLDRERALLTDLGALLSRAHAPEDARRRLADLADGLSELFLLVVAGEFNAGKSTLVNALFGRHVMEEGPVPTTDKITVLRHGEAEETHRRSEFVTERRLPAPFLEHLALVDTPGTNSIIKEHQALTEDFIPRADLVLFVTSVERPLSESERQFLEYVRETWGRRLVVAVNKADLASSEEQLQQVLTHVRDGLVAMMEQAPITFPVAARQALKAKVSQPEAPTAHPAWEPSRFGPFERFLRETLTADARLAIKLGAPLDAAGALLGRAKERLRERHELLETDAKALDALHERFDAGRATMDDAVAATVTEVDRELLEMEKRGARFLNDTIRVSKIGLLRDRAAFQDEFARQVVRDAEAGIEARIGTTADVLLRHSTDLWREVYNRLSDLRQRGEAQATDTFVHDRDAILRDAVRATRRTLDTVDLDEEARRILENARSALTVGGVTAAGVGALAVALIAMTAFDVTGGLLATGAAATLGFVVLPMQRRRAVADFTERVGSLREDIARVLTTELGEEAEKAVARVRALVEPLDRLVREQREAAEADRAEAGRLTTEMDAIRRDVRQHYGAADGIG